jgi:hypothetical protein
LPLVETPEAFMMRFGVRHRLIGAAFIVGIDNAVTVAGRADAADLIEAAARAIRTNDFTVVALVAIAYFSLVVTHRRTIVAGTNAKPDREADHGLPEPSVKRAASA